MNNQHAACDEALRRMTLERNEWQQRAEFAEALAQRLNAKITEFLKAEQEGRP